MPNDLQECQGFSKGAVKACVVLKNPGAFLIAFALVFIESG